MMRIFVWRGRVKMIQSVGVLQDHGAQWLQRMAPSQGTSPTGGKARKHWLHQQIDDLVNHPHIPKEQKIDILKGWRKRALTDAVVDGVIAGVMTGVSALSLLGGNLLIGALAGVLAFCNAKNTVTYVRGRQYALEALKKLESDPGQLQQAPGKMGDSSAEPEKS